MAGEYIAVNLASTFTPGLRPTGVEPGMERRGEQKSIFECDLPPE